MGFCVLCGKEEDFIGKTWFAPALCAECTIETYCSGGKYYSVTIYDNEFCRRLGYPVERDLGGSDMVVEESRDTFSKMPEIKHIGKPGDVSNLWNGVYWVIAVKANNKDEAAGMARGRLLISLGSEGKFKRCPRCKKIYDELPNICKYCYYVEGIDKPGSGCPEDTEEVQARDAKAASDYLNKQIDERAAQAFNRLVDIINAHAHCLVNVGEAPGLFNRFKEWYQLEQQCAVSVFTGKYIGLGRDRHKDKP